MVPFSAMVDSRPSALERLFRFIIAKRWWIIAFYALLLGPGIHFALRVDQDNSIDRLIVESDPDSVAAKKFEKVFGSGEYVVLLAEAVDPFAPTVLERIGEIEQRLKSVSRVDANSALSVYRRARAGFTATPESALEFKKFATGTDLFRKQGLVGEHFL